MTGEKEMIENFIQLSKDEQHRVETFDNLGVKYDQDKPRMALVLNGFNEALLEVGKVGTFGAEKYTDNGWKSVSNGIERYTDALYRHLLSEPSTPLDDESNLLHAAHVAWNALARLQLIIENYDD